MGRRYHPQMIRFAISIHCKSPSAYRELRDSGALILPSERVLHDYKNYFKPGAGITKENIEELKEITSEFCGIQKCVAVIMDEMKIQENLVFDKTSGELIGIIDLGDPLTTFANVDEDVPVASHALSFLVRGFMYQPETCCGILLYWQCDILSINAIILESCCSAGNNSKAMGASSSQ